MTYLEAELYFQFAVDYTQLIAWLSVLLSKGLSAILLATAVMVGLALVAILALAFWLCVFSPFLLVLYSLPQVRPHIKPLIVWDTRIKQRLVACVRYLTWGLSVRVCVFRPRRAVVPVLPFFSFLLRSIFKQQLLPSDTEPAHIHASVVG